MVRFYQLSPHRKSVNCEMRGAEGHPPSHQGPSQLILSYSKGRLSWVGLVTPALKHSLDPS